LNGGAELGAADIEPELITNLFDSAREKRRAVRYEDLPPTLVNAILSAEDKRFFEHPGLDFIRIFGARGMTCATERTCKARAPSHAGCANLLPLNRSQLAAKDRRSHALVRTRAALQQKHFRDVCE